MYKDLAKHFPTLYHSKQLEEFAPVVYGNSDQIIRRFERKEKVVLDRWFERTTVLFMERTQKLLGCEVGSSGFKIYSKDGKYERTIPLHPENHNNKVKDTKTLAFTYSELENRVGAVNDDHTLSFWDVNDDYKFEKLI